MVEVYERGGKSVIAVCEETSEDGYDLPGALNGLEKDLKIFQFRGFFIFKRRCIYRSVVGVSGLCRDKFTKEK